MVRQLRPALMSVLLFTLLTGVAFPLAITGLARAAFPHQANGSLITQHGTVIGSELIGQGFKQPQYFHPRPSAAGEGYDAANSGGTNLGPTSDKLLHGVHKKLPDGKDDPGNFDGIQDLAAAYRDENHLVPNAALPSDAVTRSASGLDPHISVGNARCQTPRVAMERKLTTEQVWSLVKQHVEPRQLGFIGEPRVNVLQLNLGLDRLSGR